MEKDCDMFSPVKLPSGTLQPVRGTGSTTTWNYTPNGASAPTASVTASCPTMAQVQLVNADKISMDAMYPPMTSTVKEPVKW